MPPAGRCNRWSQAADWYVSVLAGNGLNALPGARFAQIATQLFKPLGKIIHAGERIAAQRAHGRAIGPRCTPQPQINTLGVEGFQGAELLGDDQRRMVRQHNAAAAHADTPSFAGNMADQHRGSGAGDAVDVVVLG